MFRHMLIPTDGSALASAALEKSVALAAEMHAKVTFLVVTEPFRTLSTEAAQIERVKEEFKQYMKDRADGYLQWATNTATSRKVESDPLQVEHEHPYQAIIETARSRGCDVIAMGSHGFSGMKAVVLGSVTQKVLTHCNIPVLVYR